MKKCVFTLIISITLISCYDFLNLNPLDKPSSTTFWKTEKDYEMALTACYGAMQRNVFSCSLPCWDNLTDNSYGQHSEKQYGVTTNIVMGNVDPTSDGFISSVYEGAFADIARVNIFLKKMDAFDGFKDQIKKKYEAEARMIRAYFYSYLYRCYGDVPIVKTPLTLETQFHEKEDKEDVYKFIIEDIDFAIENLSRTSYMDFPGRWTQEAAKAYKAKMILFSGYDDKGVSDALKMGEAIDLLSSIEHFELASDFSDNFQDIKQENNPEIMMSVKFLNPNNFTNSDLWYGDWIVVSPLANLINSFEMKDGSASTPVAVNENGVIDITKFSNKDLFDRDVRLSKTVFIDRYVINDIAYRPSNNRPVGTGLSKFLSNNLNVPYVIGTMSQQDWIILRYADVLLMLAEAENELNGPSQLVYSAMNKVRRRVDMPDIPINLTKEEMREKIRHERRIELAFEGHRYFDLKRWKIADKFLNNVKDGIVKYNFENKHYLWPLPQSEIDRNQGVLIQNPDYK